MNICVALDLPTREQNLSLVRELQDFDIWLKIGLRSYIRDGKAFLDEVRSVHEHARLFLDLKLYDIPNTMADAADEIASLGVDMFNVHASAGKNAMETVMKRLMVRKTRPLVLAVTALTSFDDTEFSAIYGTTVNEKAPIFAKDAYASGLDGVVCSAWESESIKKYTTDTFLTLCPGIRDKQSETQDQKRVVDVEGAKQRCVDFAVIGRPIYDAEDPRGVLSGIMERIS